MTTRKYLPILRNIAMAALCTLWLLPLWISGRLVLDTLAWWEDNLAAAAKIPLEDYPFGSVSAFAVASFFFSIALMLLGVTIFCLVLVRLSRTGKDMRQA
jgi:hypothetical protein